MNSDTRNLSDECKICPYKDKWGLDDCINRAFPHLMEEGIYGEGCDVPYDILENIEKERNEANSRK
jgi:hypothetical protein